MDAQPLIIWYRLSLAVNPRLPVWLRDFGVDPDDELWVPTDLLEESTARRILERAWDEGIPVLAHCEHEQDSRPFLPLSFVKQHWHAPILALYESMLRAALEAPSKLAAGK